MVSQDEEAWDLEKNVGELIEGSLIMVFVRNTTPLLRGEDRGPLKGDSNIDL